jgi:hypothetical protein
MMLKNFLFYGFSTFINTWAGEAGAGEIFKVFGIVSVSLLATCIPMCESIWVNRLQDDSGLLTYSITLQTSSGRSTGNSYTTYTPGIRFSGRSGDKAMYW